MSPEGGMGYDLNIFMEIFKKLSSQNLIDLQEMEGDYRASNLPIDKAQSILYMIIVNIGGIGMLGVDRLFFKDRPDMFWQMVVYRSAFLLFTAVIIFAISKTSRVRIFDQLIRVWIIMTMLSLLLLNFIRPEDYLATVFDIVTIFAIYVLSPLKFQQNAVLAVSFSICTLFIYYFVKVGVDPITLNVATAAQFIVHTLGLGAALQLQSYRRKSYKAFIDERDAKEMVAYLANIDPLTKSLTRRHFFNIAESEFKRFERYHRPFSVLVVDADRFKNINDTHGHHAGDIVLRSLSLVAMEQKRVQDTFGRLGGEEFGLILPETTLEQARVVAERIRKVWEQTPSNMDGRLIHSTVSIGVAEAGAGDESFDHVLRRADLMMYKAKEQGRNQIVAE
jgi:diguanylate cyclase (GGDEF)-like protein